MLILRVTAQILLAAAVMVLGYDALNALKNWSIDPIAVGELVSLVANQTGLASELDLEGTLAISEGWPSYLADGYGFVLQAPAFFILGVIGLIMALLFRARG